MKDKYTEDGYRIYDPPIAKLSAAAAYGAYIINLIKEADEKQEHTGVYEEVTIMTFTDFKAFRKKENRRNLFKRYES